VDQEVASFDHTCGERITDEGHSLQAVVTWALCGLPAGHFCYICGRYICGSHYQALHSGDHAPIVPE